MRAQAPAPIVDPLDDLFPDPDGLIAREAAKLPDPTPSRAARVATLLAGAR